jgi:hypothetical protein
MTTLKKPVESKQLKENFVLTFGKSSFDLQVPKLDPSMARRLKKSKIRGCQQSGGEGEVSVRGLKQDFGHRQTASVRVGKFSGSSRGRPP